MPIQEKYTQRLGLANLDVFLDTPDNDTSYFTIGNLPQTMGYGKHGFTIAYNDPTNSDLLLKNNTGIIFEFVDANGETVFSELSDIPDLSGAATGYVWIKKDPLWIAQEIADGPLTLYVVGELDGVPEEFADTYNLRSTFTFNIRKSFPNTSKIIFYDVPALEASASFTETQEEDRKPGYTRGYINVSSSFMQTHGGKVSFIELSYQETGSQANNFTVLTEYPVEGPTSRFEVESGSVDGLNPLSHLFKVPIPRSIRRETPVKFKLRFLDADKTPAKYYDENRQNQNIEITSSAITINGTPMVIEREDNLMKGSMFVGDAVGKGFEQSGKSSAFLKTVDYTGFVSASTHVGKSGVMFFSGSVLSESGDDYRGVGLELVGDSESFFRFRSSPSVLDIRTKDLFVGSTQQFISASGGNLEISSSRFHLDPAGNVSFSGSIDASDGRIGGFVISSSEIHSDVDGRRDLRLKANGQISASSILLASSSFVIDPNNLTRFGNDGFGSFVMANSTGVSIQTTDFNLNTARFIISSSDVGVIAMGSNPPLNFDNGKGIYMSGDGNFLAGDSHGERMQFNGFNLVLSSSAFFLGNERSFMSGSQGKILVSGSDISLMTEKFFFGTATHFISGSLGNMEISSSNFAMSREGDVTLAGEIRARTGEIGGFNIGRGALSSDNFFISGAAENAELFISSSGFSVDAQGIVSASALSLIGGSVGGLAVAEGTVSVGDILKLKDTGQITGSQVLFTGGKIGGFNIDAGSIRSANGNDINLDATNKRFSINTPTFGATGIQLQFNGGTPRAHIGVTNQQGITFDGTNLLLNSQAFFLGNNDNFVSGSNGNIKISGSNVSVETPSFFLGNSAQFVSGSNGNIEITSSNFHLDSDGTLKTRGEIRATSGTIGGFTIGSDLSSTAGTLKLKGASGQITASNAQISGKITATSGEIGGFAIISNAISSSNGNLRLKSNGQITGSTALLTGGKIAGWTISGDTLVGNNATLDGAGAALFRSDAGPDTDNSAAFDILRDEYYIDFSPADQGNTKNYYVKFGPNFAVDSDGVLHASGAQFEGTVSASKGIIGGFTTDGSAFRDNNNQIFISGSPAVGGTDHPKHMFISSSNFNVKQSGDITGSSALFNGNTTIGGTLNVIGTGTIASFGLTTTAISSSNNNLILRSDGRITGSEVFFNGGKIGGFVIDSDEIKSTGGTMILDSDTRDGTIALGATPNTNIDGTNAGVYMNGLGDFLVRVNANNFIKIDQDATTKLDMKAETFFLGSGDQFISGSNGTIAISSSNFDLDTAGNVTMAGTVTATAGQIAGFTISGNSLTATNFEIDASGKRITLGDASSTDLFVADADEGIQLGNNTFGLAPFSVTKAGVLKAVAGTVGGYGISATAISSSNNNLILKNSGQITGSTVLFTGGKIGGFTIDADEIKSTNLLLDSTNEKITVGSANAITIQGGGTDNFIVMGSKSAFAQTSTAGVILGMDNNVPSFDMTRNATNYMRFDTSTGVDIKTDTFKLDTTNLDIDSSTSRVQVHSDSNEVVRLGEISDSASDLYGLKIYDGSGTADSNTLVKLGGEGNTIGGWTITNNQIRSLNLIIHSSGRLETADFASGVKGWRIDSEGNGTAEFENATIRGTLSTAVFEKETVNAVGGQLYVANSTVISGSGITSASNATMSVENVSGFVQGEIASLKKISETGFSTEYVLINSASRNDRSSDTNFSGNLFVTRGYSGSLGGQTGSLGGSPNAAQDYNPGQVLVSTGRVGTGYIRLNANPNDSATPYIDIVERTGSAIYDIELKTRVGDLSGLSSATLFGEDNPGFGIFTENGFFKGGINATTGSFTGVVHINTSANEIMKLGTNVSGTNDGIFVNNNNFLFTDGQFKTGNANNFISHDGNGNVKVISENFTLKGGNKLLMTSESLAFDTSNASTATRTAGTGVFMNDQGHFRVGVSDGNRLTFTGTSLELVTDDLNIDTSTFDLSTDGTGKIALGATPPTSISSGTGVFMDGAGNFLAGNTSGNFIRFNQSSGAVQVAGEITITAGSDISAGLPAGTVSGSGQLADAISGSLGDVSASLASGLNDASSSAGLAQANLNSVSSSVATELNTVSSSAGLGINRGNTATAAASTAQSAIDTMETQVVLNSGGMDLRNNSNLNLVSYGVNTKFFDGVGQTDGHMKLRLNTDGVFAFANTTESFARFYNEGVQLVSGSVEFAKFAGITTIGNTSTEHVRITNSGLELKDGSTVRLSMDSSGMQIGSVDNGITLNSSGDATFNGAITVSGPDIAGLTGSLDSAIAGASASAAAGQSGSALLATQVVLDSNGMSLKNAAANKTLASFGTTVVIGENADDKSRMVLDNDSLDLIVDDGGTDTTHASFGATTTIGSTTTEHVEITSTTLKLKDGGTTRISMDSSGVQIGAVSSGITLNSSGDATFNGVLSVGLKNAISGSNTEVSGALAAQTAQQLVDSASMASSVQLTNEGLNILNGSGAKLAEYGTNVFVGLQNSDHVKISTAGLEIKDNNTVVGKFTGKGAILGNDGVSHISASTLDVHIKKDNNNKAVISADGMKITQGGTEVADFGSTVVIGEVGSGKSNVQITSGAINLRNNTTNKLVLGADGSISIGNQFSVNSDGDATFAGTLSVGSLPSGTVSGSSQLADAISGSIGDVSASLATDVNAASSSAGQGINAANAAQADATAMATQVVLDSDGMSLKNQAANVTLANFGTTVTVGRSDALNQNVHIDSDSIDIRRGTQVTASFGATTTIGPVSSAHTFIDSGSLRLKDGSDERLIMDAKGIRMGNDFSVDSSGNASFSGALTIGTALANSISGSVGNVSASLASGLNDASSSAGQGINAANSAQADATAMATQVVLDSDGMALKNQAANVTLAEFGTTVTVGRADALNQNVFIDSDSIDIRRGTQVTASFGATTTIGPTSSAHTFIDSGSLRLKDGSSERLIMDAKGIRMGDQFSVDSSGNASFSGTLTVSAPGTISSSAQLADAISGSSNEFSASAASSIAGTLSDSASMASAVQLTATGLNVLDGSGNALAQFGDTVTIGEDKDNNSRIFIDNNSVDLIVDSGGTDTTQASFGATTTIGSTSGEHVSISSDAVEIKTDANTTVLSASAAGLEMKGAINATSGKIGALVINDGGFHVSGAYSDLLTGNDDVDEGELVTNNSHQIITFDELSASHLKGQNSKAGTVTNVRVKYNVTDTDSNTAVLKLVSGATTTQMTGNFNTSTTGTNRVTTFTGNHVYEKGNDITLRADSHPSGTNTDMELTILEYQVTASGAGLPPEDEDSGGMLFDANKRTIISRGNFLLGDGNQFISGSNSNLELTSSKLHIKPDGDLVVRKINANEGSIAQFTIDNAGLTGNASSVLTSSIDATTIRLTSQVPNSSGNTFAAGAKQVQRLIRIESGKVQEATAIHYKGPNDFDDAHPTTGLSTAYIGKRADMKEDLGWFQEMYTNNNFANTGHYSAIQIQIDTGSAGTEPYGGSATPMHGGLHGSTGIHLGTATSAFSATTQAPLSSGWLGKTNLSLFANGNISGSNQTSASFGTLTNYTVPYIIEMGNDITTTSEVFLNMMNQDNVDRTSITGYSESHQIIVPFAFKFSHVYARFESDPGDSCQLNIYEVPDGQHVAATSDASIGRFAFPSGLTADTVTSAHTGVWASAAHQFQPAGTVIAVSFSGASSIPNDTNISLVLMLDPSKK